MSYRSYTDNSYRNYNAHPTDRYEFVGKVYGLLTSQIVLLTALTFILSTIFPSVCLSVLSHPFIFILTFLGLSLALYFYRKKHPANLALFTAATALMSLPMGAMAFHDPSLTAAGLGLALVPFVGLTAYTLKRRKQPSPAIGAAFGIGALSLCSLVYTISALVLHRRVDSLLYLGVSLLVECLYVVVDTDRVLRVVPDDDYVYGAFILFGDFVRLAVKIMEVIAKLQEKDKDKRRDRRNGSRNRFVG
ncbi:hypothetical protein J8273_0132 [Carpediemonas membranifera]|uniref:Uncharacterized protein n=1 Tax=Carpediemonas membranifera TaxID=201153 RepID=A0A8J6B5W2_9EUKA|nr:hypothetical protein J8273_0132 [Carpediemonas membranifera]|eukprot:KAG9394924.1 hypothetical protein J8273_0132 [Carpediemonas membranifera]